MMQVCRASSMARAGSADRMRRQAVSFPNAAALLQMDHSDAPTESVSAHTPVRACAMKVLPLAGIDLYAMKAAPADH